MVPDDPATSCVRDVVLAVIIRGGRLLITVAVTADTPPAFGRRSGGRCG
jgi:hypothetical protein